MGERLKARRPTSRKEGSRAWIRVVVIEMKRKGGL